MKYRIINIFIAILFISGLSLLFYSRTTSFLSSQEVENQVVEFEKRLQSLKEPDSSSDEFSISPEEAERLYADIQAYNADIYEKGQFQMTDPFSYEVAEFELKKYGILDDMFGYISIPKMDVKLPIYLGASTANLAKGAASLGQTSLPIGGNNTNAVLAAHRGYRGIPMFQHIESLELGDKIYIANYWGTMVYEVVETKIILPNDSMEVYIQPGRDLVTLITCHPYTQNYQRYVVYCERTADEEYVEEKVPGLEFSSIFRFNQLSESQQLIYVEYWAPIFIIAFLLLLAAIWLLTLRSKRKKRKNNNEVEG